MIGGRRREAPPVADGDRYNRAVPLYEYTCQDCGADLEILHAVGKPRTCCGLDCRLQGPGAFGKGEVRQRLSTPNLSTGATRPSLAEVGREALRQKGLRKLGGELTEKDLDKLRDKGVAVYRRESQGRWDRTGGDDRAPTRLEPGDDS